MAVVARRLAERNREVARETGTDRSAYPGETEARVLADRQRTRRHRRCAHRRRHMQRVSHACSSGAVAATETRRARTLRGMSSHSLSGARRILKVIAYVDGASRVNPGPAGYGVFMKTKHGDIIEITWFLDTTSNNVAEYSALVDALTIAYGHGATEGESS